MCIDTSTGEPVCTNPDCAEGEDDSPVEAITTLKHHHLTIPHGLKESCVYINQNRLENSRKKEDVRMRKKSNPLVQQFLVVGITLILLVTSIAGNIICAFRINKLANTPAQVVTVIDEQVVETVKEVEKKVIVEVEKETNYTHDELYCMAVAIYNEAGGNACTDEHREMVGYVVLNRVNDSRYPDTIRGVLEQPGQYEGLGSKGVNFAKRSSNDLEAKALERAWDTAKKVLENRDNIPIPENVVFQAEFQQGKGVYKQLGNTYFCY
jgi:hypothetical protein